MEQEIWKDIKGYEGRYQVSNTGKVRSLHQRKGFASGTIMQTKKHKGYLTIGLRYEGGRKYFPVHVLVLTAFKGPKPSELHECMHLNDVKDDNRIENLRWGTHTENMQDASQKGLLHNSNPWAKGIASDRHPRAKKVAMVDSNGNVIIEFGCLKDAAEKTSIDVGTVRAHCAGQREKQKFKFL